MLVSRSLLLQGHKLMPAASNEEKAMANISARLQAVLRADVSKLKGMQMLFKSLIAICQGRKDEGRPVYEQSMENIAKQCMSRHSALCAQQSIAQKAGWNERARQHASARHHLLNLEWQALSS